MVVEKSLITSKKLVNLGLLPYRIETDAKNLTHALYSDNKYKRREYSLVKILHLITSDEITKS